MEKNEVIEDFSTIQIMRAIVFEAFASTSELRTIYDVAKETSLSLDTIKGRVNELVEAHRLYPCGRVAFQGTGELELRFTSNPYVASEHYKNALDNVFDILASFPKESCELLRAIIEYAVNGNESIPDFIFTEEVNLGRIWRELVKPILDKEIQR